ncbi:MAG: class I SAM-dependent methyltransferase [Planctomycetota bacterium]|nr:class I SAM-dependent methyltransferase [Planctomycetota bacterium]
MSSGASGAGVRRVVQCYSLFDKFFPTCGLLDYTEGIYHGDPNTPYAQAQLNQINYLLDEVRCRQGVRILDVGCGNGTLLEEVRRRGAVGTGITISPEQAGLCRRRGLDVRLLDYRELAGRSIGPFDAVIANGAIEHFVQVSDAAAGEAEQIYARMFRLFHGVIDPKSSIRRMVNTTTHFVRGPDPKRLLAGPLAFRPFSDDFHYALLIRSFGGFYPADGQLERCARGFFRLLKAEDGTRDSFFTSEEWLRRVRKALRRPTGLKIMARSLPSLVRLPGQFITMITCMLITRSWNWQFRTDHPPARLLRQTWEYEPASV